MGKYTKVYYGGVQMDAMTRRAIKWAERRAGFKFEFGQGSYNKGGVSKSAGTHDGGGVIDFKTVHLSRARRFKMNRALKNGGWAIWYRNWTNNQHVHGCLFGNTRMAPGARDQLSSFDRGRDGLANDGVDSTYRPSPKVRFHYFLHRPVKRK